MKRKPNKGDYVMFNDARETIIAFGDRPSVHHCAPFDVPAEGSDIIVIIADQTTAAPPVWAAEEPY
jgi:hypothetical protein